MYFSDLQTPCALVDLDRLATNLDRMASSAVLHGLARRPHVKTHKSPRIAAEQMRLGAAGLTCATPRELEVMSDVSRDLLLAYPLLGEAKGKNPEDVWEIPNVKSDHIEKTDHPCQYPVGLIERLALALTNEGDLIFDPFAGVASAGVAAALHGRRFWGVEIMENYATTGVRRMQEALDGKAAYRPHDKPLYDHTKSKLSRTPEELEKIKAEKASNDQGRGRAR